MEAWQSPVYCDSLENCRELKPSVSSNLTASAIQNSSEVEQLTVNQLVVGSIPTLGANLGG